MFFAIVSFGGGGWPRQKVFDTEAKAREAIRDAGRECASGEAYIDPQVLARVRINAYATREAAERADISDTTDRLHGGFTPGFVRVVRG